MRPCMAAILLLVVYGWRLVNGWVGSACLRAYVGRHAAADARSHVWPCGESTQVRSASMGGFRGAVNASERGYGVADIIDWRDM